MKRDSAAVFPDAAIGPRGRAVNRKQNGCARDKH